MTQAELKAAQEKIASLTKEADSLKSATQQLSVLSESAKKTDAYVSDLADKFAKVCRHSCFFFLQNSC